MKGLASDRAEDEIEKRILCALDGPASPGDTFENVQTPGFPPDVEKNRCEDFFLILLLVEDYQQHIGRWKSTT